MEGMNKFKVLMVIVVFMFLFVVAAIYTNTKEASQNVEKHNDQSVSEQINDKNIMQSINNKKSSEPKGSDIDVINERIDSLSARLDDIEARSNYTCRVYGVLSVSGVEQLSADSAVEEARNNNKELVLSCSF